MDYFVGEVLEMDNYFRDLKGFIRCEGQLLPISTFYVLFSLLGTTHGGDGVSSFALPDLRGKSALDTSPTDCHFYICNLGIYPSRN